MSGVGKAGRGRKFWDEQRLRRLRALRDSGCRERTVMQQRFGVGDSTIQRGLEMLREQDAAREAGR